MSAAEVLSKARDVLAERGWVQETWQTDQGVCIVGAFDLVLPEGIDDRDDILDLLQPSVGAYGFAALVKWNDAPERTYEDVVLALKRAEELASS